MWATRLFTYSGVLVYAASVEYTGRVYLQAGLRELYTRGAWFYTAVRENPLNRFEPYLAML